MRRAAPPAVPVTEPRRCLRVRDGGVWALAPGDELAGARWRQAATSWRAAASESGMTNAEVWSALPAARFLARPDEDRLNYMLWGINCTAADLAALAQEARAFFPEVFDPMWAPGGVSPGFDWHLRELRHRRGELGEP